VPTNNVNSEMYDPTKIKQKELELTLDENDDVLDCIKQAMRENNIHHANVVTFEGKVLNFSVNYFENSTLKNVKYFEPHEIVKGLGELKYDFIKDFIFGRVRIIYKHKDKNFDGILMSGKALSGFKIILTYLEQKE